MCIFSLEMYISNLEMKTQTALSCFFCHFQTSFRRIVSHDQWLFAVVRIRAGIYFFPIFEENHYFCRRRTISSIF